MRRLMLWLAFAVTGATLAVPAYAGWSGKPVNDGHGHSFFLMSASADGGRAEVFCSPEGDVNFSLIWPDRNHGAAADAGAPVDMTVATDAGASFAAKSWYWASGKGDLVLDYGNPTQVRNIVDAIAAAGGVTVTVDDASNGIEKQVAFDVEGAVDAAAAFGAWCPR